ncbi:hypothetical protein GXP70_14260 [Paenibacillus lycopersici]|uniref:Uncharacterized protein n=1 Tax=Paenibacillus lycopersici TaxID=2704462 RepID=A0A6C0FV33_9BACL|nr:hypothetical protein [Paenibacillus lycopersici]QHT60998.1 hypothetical protein GXP70_14260 [Paenibacillus lycopersici]
MITVKVKSKEHAFTIPVPYIVLRMGCIILTSGFVMRKLKVWLNKRGGHTVLQAGGKAEFGPDRSRVGINLVLTTLEQHRTKRAIRKLIRELQRCKGTVLVDVRAQDGTEVMIRL